MKKFRVATEALHTTARGWHSLAAELTGTTPAAPDVSFQVSAAAVTAIHAGVAAASEALTARTQITAAKTTTAAIAYTENEATSAAVLGALSESL